jgi:uncharacterized protein (DUF1697 family)
MRQILLLRGINVGAHNRIAMPALRELLAEAGFEDVRTYVQSGNVVLSSDLAPQQLSRECERCVADGLGLDVAIVARTRDELAEVVRRDPLAEVAVNPKRYQVSFCSAEPDSELVQRLTALAAPDERFVALGRELYAWHPQGVARSRLWAELAGRKLGLTATARSWSTVTTLLAMADE